MRKFLRADRRRALYASTAWFIGQLPMSAALARVLSMTPIRAWRTPARLVRNCDT
jgi:hypothetical protein